MLLIVGNFDGPDIPLVGVAAGEGAISGPLNFVQFDVAPLAGGLREINIDLRRGQGSSGDTRGSRSRAGHVGKGHNSLTAVLVSGRVTPVAETVCCRNARVVLRPWRQVRCDGEHARGNSGLVLLNCEVEPGGAESVARRVRLYERRNVPGVVQVSHPPLVAIGRRNTVDINASNGPQRLKLGCKVGWGLVVAHDGKRVAFGKLELELTSNVVCRGVNDDPMDLLAPLRSKGRRDNVGEGRCHSGQNNRRRDGSRNTREGVSAIFCY